MACHALTEPQISEILNRRFAARVSAVVGIVDATNRRIVSYGFYDTSPVRTTGDTVFEIGSVTKVFTALILAELVQRGVVNFSDPVQAFLPAKVRVPDWKGQQITLGHLVNHTSGLPRVPLNLCPKDPENPYVDYRAEHLYEFLGTYQLPRDIGSRFEYSNLGFGLLGLVLELRAGVDYESLARAVVLDPLGMISTVVRVRPEMKIRLAHGYDGSDRPTKSWDLGVLVGAGGLKSSANDMMTFLAANLGYVESPLRAAMLRMRSVRGVRETEDSIGWRTREGINT